MPHATSTAAAQGSIFPVPLGYCVCRHLCSALQNDLALACPLACPLIQINSAVLDPTFWEGAPLLSFKPI